MIYPEFSDVTANQATPATLENAFRTLHSHLLAQVGEVTRHEIDQEFLDEAMTGFKDLHSLSWVIESNQMVLDTIEEGKK